MRDKSVNPAEQKATVKTRLKTGLLIFLCLLMILTAGAIFYTVGNIAFGDVDEVSKNVHCKASPLAGDMCA